VGDSESATPTTTCTCLVPFMINPCLIMGTCDVIALLLCSVLAKATCMYCMSWRGCPQVTRRILAAHADPLSEHALSDLDAYEPAVYAAWLCHATAP
jgi:hypothetical protein